MPEVATGTPTAFADLGVVRAVVTMAVMAHSLPVARPPGPFRLW